MSLGQYLEQIFLKFDFPSFMNTAKTLFGIASNEAFLCIPALPVSALRSDCFFGCADLSSACFGNFVFPS